MESVVANVPLGPATLTATLIGIGVIIFVFFAKWFRQETEHTAENEKLVHNKRNSVVSSAVSTGKQKKDQGGTVSKQASKKKLTERESRRNARTGEKTFGHPWLLASLKGHGGRVLDMDFAANGKYLASCGDEDPDPDGMSTTESTSSSSSESNKENSRPTSAEHSPLLPKGLSRRQRKNRKREPKYVTPAEPPKPTKTKVSNQCKSKVAAHHVEPLEEFKKLNISESLFAQMLVNNYVLRSEHMAILGYPARPNKRAIISDKMVYMYKKHHFDINAKEFVPKSDSNDSGQCSGSSSEEESSSSSDDSSPRYRNTPFYGRVCVRCGSWFYTTSNTYITDEACSYHWGKLRTHGHGYGPLEYTCCNGKNGSKGCSEAKVHVWNGPAEPLVNSSYVETEKPKHVSEDGNYGVFALDCEMSYTVTGLEVTKVTLVSMEGKIMYNEYVRPKNEVVDYNTRFSGITADDFKNNRSKTLQQVQRDLKKLINSKTVLIGHALENDLKGLRMIHKTVVDTTFTFPHDKGFPFKRSLKSLVRSCLKRDIQCSEKGHDSYEDARASMELMLYRLRRDFSL